MEKFTLLPNTAKKSITGVEMVSHNHTPICEIEIIDLRIQQAKEEMDDSKMTNQLTIGKSQLI